MYNNKVFSKNAVGIVVVLFPIPVSLPILSKT